MNKSNDSVINDLIGKINSAIKDGNTAQARDYAAQAANLDPQSEQAWLLLASLSEPEQALLFIENALRANPHSQAARKAIRLVYRQMAAKEKPAPSEVPTESLTDTSPIPVVPPNSDLGGKEPQSRLPAEQIEKTDAFTTSISKKELLLKKLRKKGVSPEPASSVPGQPVKLIKKSVPHARLQLVKEKSTTKSESGTGRILGAKSKISVENPASSAVNVVESAEGISSEEPSIGKQEIRVEPPFPKPIERKSRAVKTRKPAPRLAPAQPNADPTKKAAQEKSSLPLQVRAQEPKPVKRSGSPRIRRESADVETIELVLVSTAVILIPLLVFLYFYLTR